MSTIWTTPASAANTSFNTVPKTRVTTVTMSAVGLRPNSSYAFWCNGVDMTWACRNPGSRQGAGLVSDDTGSMTVLFSVEMVGSGSQSSQPASTKYHNMSLVDINGKVSSISVVQQQLTKK